MSQPDLANRLNEAINLINTGRRAEARAILLDLSQRYPDVEQVWLWLASSTEDTGERITYLRRVLAINPRNDKARTALTRLSGEAPPPLPNRGSAPRSTPPAPSGPSAKSIEGGLIGILLAVIVIIIVVIGTVTVATLLQPRPTATFTPTLTRTLIPTATLTPTITPGGPTLTPVVGATLPPSWTPQPSMTLPPTRTLAPSWTPRPSNTPSQTSLPKSPLPLPPQRSPGAKGTLPTVTPGGPAQPSGALTPTANPQTL